MYDIETLEEFLKFWINHGWIPSIKQDRVKQYLKQLENLIKENKELKEKLEEKDMQHEIELIGKEEYTKDAMGEIIEHYYTANEDCIPKSKIKEKIEELEKEIEEKQENGLDFTLIHEHEIDTNGIIKVLQELLEEGEQYE